MAAYTYSAINAEGLQLAGEVHAPDSDAAREQLRVRGLLPEFLQELPASGEESARTVFKKIKPKTLQISSRQSPPRMEAARNGAGSLGSSKGPTAAGSSPPVIAGIPAAAKGARLSCQPPAPHPR